jgi:hypothetical protein
MNSAQFSLNSRLLMTISLAVPALLAFGSVAQAQSPVPSNTTIAASASKPSVVVERKPAAQIDVNQLGIGGCPACRSGLDARFVDRVNPVVKPVVVQPQVRQ